MQVVFDRPAVEEAADGNQKCSGDQQRCAVLWNPHSVVSGFEFPVHLASVSCGHGEETRGKSAIHIVAYSSHGLSADGKSDGHGDVVQARNFIRLAVLDGPNGNVGRQRKVEQTVDVCHVDCEYLDDGLGEDQLGGSDERPRQNMPWGSSLMYRGVSSADRTPTQENRGERFGDGENPKGLDPNGKSRSGIKHPPPVRVSYDKSSHDGTQSRAQQCKYVVQAEALPPLFRSPAISEDSRPYGRRGTANTS